MSELVDLSTPAVDDPGQLPPAPEKAPGRLRGALFTAVGGIGLLAALLALGNRGWVQLLAVVVAAVVLYLGAANLCRLRFGTDFDLMAWLCGAWLVLLVGAAILAPALPLPEHQDLSRAITEPTMARPNLLTDHPLGTNNFGLDLLGRVVYGARASLVVSIGAVLIALVVGGAVGIVAGYFRRVTDVVVGMVTNSLLAVPPLVLLIALATVLEPTLRNIALALSLLALPSMIRMARANTLSFAQREFVVAAKAMGASAPRVMLRELLPNVLLPLASYAMVMISVLIVAEASLSFLGLGIQAPEPSWGNMIAEGQGDEFKEHPHIVLVPGTVLFLTVYSFNLLGERARQRFDARSARM